jgi:hypothetical protein
MLLRNQAGRSEVVLYLMLISIVLYVWACAVPAVFTPSHGAGEWTWPAESVPGWKLLLFGWGVLPWYANPAWLAGLICLAREKNQEAWILGVAATILGLTNCYFFPPSIFLPYTFLDPRSKQSYSLNGYFLWQASLIMLLIAARRAIANERLAGGKGQTSAKHPDDDLL